MKLRNAPSDPRSTLIHRRYGLTVDTVGNAEEYPRRPRQGAVYIPRPKAGAWTRRVRVGRRYYRWMYDDAGRYHGEFLTRWQHVRLTLAEWWDNGIRRPR